jgi:type I restriction enzyme S subunit
MNIKQGYKQTEIGIIPEDWEVKKFSEIGECVIGLTYKPENVKEDGILVLRSSNVKGNALKFDDNVFVNIAVGERLITQVGDILICVRNGSRNLIGKSAIIDENSKGLTFGAFMSIFRTPYYDFVFQLFQSDILQRQIKNNLGATINQITNKDLNSFEIPFPPKQEQTAIATALSDIDALIGELDKLIAKKQGIKQATMQQLLTGKKRLAGFGSTSKYKQTEIGIIPEDWEIKTLGDLLDFQGGSQPPKQTFIFQEKIGYIRLLQIRDYKGDKYETYIPLKLAKKICNVDDIMIGRYGPPIFQILNGLDGAYNVALIKAIPREEIFSKKYEWFILKQEKLFQFVEKLSQRSSGQTGVDLFELKKYQIPLPPLKEQAAIANILSDMDAEISQLEGRRAKMGELKQGMMQELLTGRIRLI